MNITSVNGKKIEDYFGKYVLANKFGCKKCGGFAIFDLNKNQIAKAESLVLESCSIQINENERLEMIRTGRRFNHAFIKGILTRRIKLNHDISRVIDYNPYKSGRFFYENSQNEVPLIFSESYFTDEKISILE